MAAEWILQTYTRVRPRITTYALKPDVGRVLVKLGQRALGGAWNKGTIDFPTRTLARATDWPNVADVIDGEQ